MFKIDELAKLAARLDLAATVSEAESKTHAEHGELELAQQKETRATSGRHYAEVCRYFAKMTRARERTKGWTPPTFGEVLSFVQSDTILPEIRKWPATDIRAWFDHFESNGWKVSGKTPMKNWQSAARNGCRRWLRENTAKAVRSPENGDPEGWAEFLKERKRPYKQFRYEMQFLREDFSKWKPAT